MHLLFDGTGAKKHLDSIESVYRFLDTYPSKIGMNKIAPPYVFEYRGTKPEDWGITGTVPIAESHINIDTFPEHTYVSVDIYSCKAFDSTRASRFLRHYFECSKVRHQVVKRGLEYVKEQEDAGAN